ncbi:MAG: hypothetical protein KME21_14545 [Desmonostoc vinosum HA7617-LM4]|nr:hypothetical protein [Desmonostoc vinosum HA7617-LM4]
MGNGELVRPIPVLAVFVTIAQGDAGTRRRGDAETRGRGERFRNGKIGFFRLNMKNLPLKAASPTPHSPLPTPHSRLYLFFIFKPESVDS